MKIVKLTAENIKRLSAVEISPDGSVIKISGKNASGKTSVLDSIWWAMGGGENVQEVPIHKGAKTGNIKLDLGDLQVERKFSEKGTSLIVTNKDGARYQSPQKMLDDLVGTLSFDPLEFMRLKPKEQAEQLRSIVSIGGDIDKLDADRKIAFDSRTMVNRSVKEKAGAVKNNPVDPDAPDELVSAAVLLDKINEAEELNRNNREISDSFGRAKKHEAVLSEDLKCYDVHLEKTLPLMAEKLREDVAKLESDFELSMDQLKRANKIKKDIYKAATKATSEIGSQVNNLKDADVDSLRTELSGVEIKNDAARNKQTAIALDNELRNVEKQSADLTKEIKAIDDKKAELMEAVEFPTDGLSFEDGVVIYNDLPLDQASSAEQLRVSMSIAMSANPKFRVIRITDGSLMDSDSFKIIEKMADENDFQIWVEVVDETGKVGIVIEDGQVAKIN